MTERERTFKSERNAWLQVRANAEELGRWTALAEKWGMGLSGLVRRLLDTACEQEGGAKVVAEDHRDFDLLRPEPKRAGTRLSGSKKKVGREPKVSRCPHGLMIVDGVTMCERCKRAHVDE